MRRRVSHEDNDACGNAVQNDDGTPDIFFRPKAPKGKEANWLATAPGRGFFAILRLYGPEEAAIEYGWKPGDFEKAD